MNVLVRFWSRLTGILPAGEFCGQINLSFITNNGSIVGSGFPVLLKL